MPPNDPDGIFNGGSRHSYTPPSAAPIYHISIRTAGAYGPAMATVSTVHLEGGHGVHSTLPVYILESIDASMCIIAIKALTNPGLSLDGM